MPMSCEHFYREYDDMICLWQIDHKEYRQTRSFLTNDNQQIERWS